MKGKTRYEILRAVPSVEDYCRLRKVSGLSPKTEEMAAIGLPNSFLGVTIMLGGQAVGMGRVIGDGGCFFQIVDIAVDPAHQGMGLGKTIMECLMAQLAENAPSGAYISLIADIPADRLYSKFGFSPTAPRSVGMARLL